MKLCSLVCSPSPKSFHKTYEAFACGGLPFSGRSFYVGRRRYVIFRIHFICKKIYEKASQCEYALKLFPMHTILCMCRYNSFMNVKGIPMYFSQIEINRLEKWPSLYFPTRFPDDMSSKRASDLA